MIPGKSLYIIYMKTIINEEVANYLNNKFGDDFTLTEPYPERMSEENEPMTDTAYKCWCDAEDDLQMQVSNEDYEEHGNLVGYLRIRVVNDDEAQGNLIIFDYEEV